MEGDGAALSVASRLSASHPASLLYGAIVTGAVLVTTGGPGAEITMVLSSWAVVLTIYWLTHVYVHASESQFHGDTRNLLHRSLGAAKEEWAVLLGGVPAMVVFVVAATTDTDVFDAARLALFVTMALLATFGFIGARHAGRSVGSAWGEAAVHP